MNQPTDYLNQPLYPGDRVVFADDGYLKKGIINKVNPVMSIIHFALDDWTPKNTSAYSWSWSTRKENKRILKWNQ
jgi:hypothetical protein